MRIYTKIDGFQSIIIEGFSWLRFIQSIGNPAIFQICSKFGPILSDCRVQLTCSFCKPYMAGDFRTLYFVTTPWTQQGTDVFLGSNFWTRGRKEKRMVAPLRNKKSLRYATLDLIFFLPSALNLMGAWQQISLGSVPITIEKTRVQVSKRGSADLGLCPFKKNVLFCNGEVFFLDRVLLMGAMIINSTVIEIVEDKFWKPLKFGHLKS